jgi:hypothetical protein
MPSRRHELLVELFRRRPQLVAALLAPVAPALVPDVAGAAYSAASGEVASVHHGQHRADLILHRTAPGRAGPVHAFIVEVQLAPDPDKEHTWPLYVASVRVRDGCPVTLVVLALRERTARWAAAPRALRIGGPAVVAPVVIGPAQIPRITDIEEARALPELAVLSAAAHGRTPGAEHIARAAIAACAALDAGHQTLYVDFVAACLSPQARHALEVLMPTTDLITNFRPLSPGGKRIFAEGYQRGHIVGLRGLLTRQLMRRFGSVSGDTTRRIRAASPEQLGSWGERLLSARSLDEVFTDATHAT